MESRSYDKLDLTRALPPFDEGLKAVDPPWIGAIGSLLRQSPGEVLVPVAGMITAAYIAIHLSANSTASCVGTVVIAALVLLTSVVVSRTLHQPRTTEKTNGDDGGKQAKKTQP